MKRAFTLIELLIVIAIIAILALIAVPNFLEAQTRAKVSRALADMRSLSVAIEAYAVDWGRVPVDGNEYDKAFNRKVNDKTVQRVLTTPVAYISAVPGDYFIDKGHTELGGAKNYARKPYRFRNFLSHAGLPSNSEEERVAALGYIWTTRTLGPARTALNPDDPCNYVNENNVLLGRAIYVYDATNGTTSFGLITISNKGLIEGRLLGGNMPIATN